MERIVGKRAYNRMFDEGYEREVYVDDQCCKNCRYYCDWEGREHDGCKNYSREDYEQYPESNWCIDWKGKRGSHGSRGRRRGGC